MANVNQPAVGFIKLPNYQDTGIDPMVALAADIKRLADALAPVPNATKISFSALAVGVIQIANIAHGFNSILVCLTQGAALLNFGSQSNAIADMQISVSSNPVLIPIIPHSPNTQLNVTPVGTDPLIGCIWVQNY